MVAAGGACGLTAMLACSGPTGEEAELVDETVSGGGMLGLEGKWMV